MTLKTDRGRLESRVVRGRVSYGGISKEGWSLFLDGIDRYLAQPNRTLARYLRNQGLPYEKSDDIKQMIRAVRQQKRRITVRVLSYVEGMFDPAELAIIAREVMRRSDDLSLEKEEYLLALMKHHPDLKKARKVDKIKRRDYLRRAYELGV